MRRAPFLVSALALITAARLAAFQEERAAASGTLPLTLQQSACSSSVTPASISAGAGAASGDIVISVAAGCAWTASSPASWITIQSPAGGIGIGPGTVHYSLAANTGASRSALLGVGSQSVPVSQSGRPFIPVAVFRDVWGGMRLTRYGSPTLLPGGGEWASEPGTARNSAGDVFIVARDKYNALWASVYRAATGVWESWRFGGGAVQGQPAIAVAPSGIAYISARDNWNAYWLLIFDGTAFSGWLPLGGDFSTDPTTSAAPDGSVYIVGKDRWNALWSGRYVPGTGWQGFRFGGGVIQGKPSVAAGTDSVGYVVARDPWNALWMARVQHETWLGWTSAGGAMTLDPLAAADGQGTIQALVRDPWGGEWTCGYTEGSSSGWLAWHFTGGSLADGSPTAGVGSLHVAGRDVYGHVWWYSAASGVWTWMGWGGTVGGPPIAAP